MRNYENLDVWEKSHQLALAVYESTDNFPEQEKYSLTDQIRQASVSIPSNIAEGCGKESTDDFLRFLLIARGSCNELDYQLHLANDLGYLPSEETKTLRNKTNEISKMLTGLINYNKNQSD